MIKITFDNGLHNCINYEDKDIYYKLKTPKERSVFEKQTNEGAT